MLCGKAINVKHPGETHWFSDACSCRGQVYMMAQVSTSPCGNDASILLITSKWLRMNNALACIRTCHLTSRPSTAQLPASSMSSHSHCGRPPWELLHNAQNIAYFGRLCNIQLFPPYCSTTTPQLPMSCREVML